jgi:hypothetical protein
MALHASAWPIQNSFLIGGSVAALELEGRHLYSNFLLLLHMLDGDVCSNIANLSILCIKLNLNGNHSMIMLKCHHMSQSGPNA